MRKFVFVFCAPEQYLISDKAEVLNYRTNKFLKHHVNKYGYVRVVLRVNGKTKNMQLHRLVAQSFYGENKNLQVNHIDGVKTNNNLKNLEFVTASENIKHAFKCGLMANHLKGKTGMRHPKFKGSIKVTNIKSGETFICNGSKEIKEKGFNCGEVYKCVNGKAAQHKGFLFERIN